MEPPLILTLDLDQHACAFFDRLRKAHFPPDRNFLPAHLTLFHHLPGDDFPAVRLLLVELAGQLRPIPLQVIGVRFLGRGVAFALASEQLAETRSDIALIWWDRLTAQDRQPFRPHVTVQNKVEPAIARRLFAELDAGHAPFTVTGTGFHLWRYLGPQWESVGTYPFVGTDPVRARRAHDDVNRPRR